MTTTTLVYAGSLVTTQCWCGIHLAIPDSLYNEAQRNHKKDVYCPLGHPFIYGGETEAQKLGVRLKAAQDREAALRARNDQTEASLRATKGHVTRLRKKGPGGGMPVLWAALARP